MPFIDKGHDHRIRLHGAAAQLTQPNSDVEADVALAALGTTQLNASR
jgi:hypothetical protein